MIVVNFSHPITEIQQGQIEDLTGTAIGQIINEMPQFDEQQPFGPQLELLVAAVPLSSSEWQSAPILVVLPSLNFIAAMILAELHGRMGYFPPVVRTRPLADAMPRRYEVAEILDLQVIREKARMTRRG